MARRPSRETEQPVNLPLKERQSTAKALKTEFPNGQDGGSNREEQCDCKLYLGRLNRPLDKVKIDSAEPVIHIGRASEKRKHVSSSMLSPGRDAKLRRFERWAPKVEANGKQLELCGYEFP